MIKETLLPPVKESSKNYERIEARIRAAFRSLLYYPLAAELEISKDVFQNEKPSALQRAIARGQVRYSDGVFKGRFNAEITKELRKLGAIWRNGDFKLATLPLEIRAAVSASEARFLERLARIDKQLAKNLPEEIAGAIKVTDLIDSTIWQIDRDVRKTIKSIAIVPKLKPEQVEQISREWGENLELWIKDFTEEEIKRLRKDVEQSTFQGNRYEHLVKSIQRSYGVSAAKAKFLARQETSLLMTKFKETRYTDAGITKYRWGCVAGSKNHPVRPAHKALEGKTFSWNDPPITTPPGESVRRNNPGQDYNCRCFAVPIVQFHKGTD